MIDADQYLTSIKRLHFLALLVAVTSVVFSVQSYFRAFDYAAAVTVHYLGSLNATADDKAHWSPLSASKLETLSSAARAIQVGQVPAGNWETTAGATSHMQPLNDQKSEEVVSRAFLATGAHSRFNPRAPCAVTVFNVEGEELLPT